MNEMNCKQLSEILSYLKEHKNELDGYPYLNEESIKNIKPLIKLCEDILTEYNIRVKK